MLIFGGEFTMIKVAVTGGAGFIGSNLVSALSDMYKVIVLDDLTTGKQDNLSDPIQQNKITFIRSSILDLNKLTEIFHNVDFVFHQAALPSVPRSIADPILVNEINVHGTLNVLKAAKENNVKKVIFASSSSVYGDTAILPKVETMTPNPQSPYAVTKVTGEYYCQVFKQIYHLPTVCLRYFNVYGRRQDPHSQYSAVIPKFISLIKQNKSPVIFGDGEQTRDFTYIQDVVQANILAAQTDASGIYNIGSGSRTSVNNLVMMIGKILGKEIKPVYEPKRAGDVNDSLASIERARTFGYKPQYTLEQGLSDTIKQWNF
jgi:UDP-glucose 4-epimerase